VDPYPPFPPVSPPPVNPAGPTGPSLTGGQDTVLVPSAGPGWKQWLAVAGPALLVSVGYMDPGNWATDIAGGSRYGYRLLWVLLMSNLMAILLQSLAARLGIVRRRDLAQASRETFPRAVNLALYLLAEIAIASCDLAEVIGSAIALNLLFGLPLLVGIIITTFDVLILLALTQFGIRKLEAVVLSLVTTIGLAFVVEMLLAKPAMVPFMHGFIPGLPDSAALYFAIGIIGATVMPHNLYLHSALVQTRNFGPGNGTRRALFWNNLDSAVALNIAFFVNVAILVMGAAVFHKAGHFEVAEIQDAYHLLEPLLGVAFAPIVFAIGLLAAGQSSTITGTLAGQIVMEGYLDIRIRPWLRRMITRILAVLPAVVTIVLFGEKETGKLLVLSQVVLSLQLPFAMIPLIHFVADKRRMGAFVIGPWLKGCAWVVAVVIVGLNGELVRETVTDWIASAGPRGIWIKLMLFPLLSAIALLLGWISLEPWLTRLALRRAVAAGEIHPAVRQPVIAAPIAQPLRKVALALDFSGNDVRLIETALAFLAPAKPPLALLHVVESASARAFGRKAADLESDNDQSELDAFAESLRRLGYQVETALGAGDPAPELARLANELEADLVILGGHGHRGLMDMIYGTTVEGLRHRTRAKVLVIPSARSQRSC
jgi:manganese transport protein